MKELQELIDEFIKNWGFESMAAEESCRKQLRTLLEKAFEEQRKKCFKNYKQHQAENIAGKVKESWNTEGGQSHDLGKAVLTAPSPEIKL